MSPTRRRGGAPGAAGSARGLILPAAGAGLYALATSRSFTRQAKDVMVQARSRASELPEDLLGRIRETSPTSAGGNGGGGSRSRRSSTRKTRSSSRKTASSR